MSALISKSDHAGNQIEVTIGNGNWGAFQRVPRVARAGGAAVKSEMIHSSIPSPPQNHLFALPEGTNVVSSELVMPVQILRSSFCPSALIPGFGLVVCPTPVSFPEVRPQNETVEKRP
jgi:hypothetical protein